LKQANTDVQKEVSRLQEQDIRLHKKLTERYENFSDPSIGLTETVRCFDAIAAAKGVETKDLDPVVKTMVAKLCENFVKETKQNIAETDRGSMPQWIKTGLALISATFAQNILDDIVSVQPLSNRSGRVHYLDIQTENAKGDIAMGTRIFNALSGFSGESSFGSHEVPNEPVGAAGAAAYPAIVLGYTPVIPGTLVLSDGTQNVRDDHNGLLIGDTGAGAPPINTVNYLTGAVNVNFAAVTTGPVTATYSYNIEAALQLPEVGIVLRSETVQALPRALAARWSVQSVQDFIADYGINAEPTIIDAAGRVIQSETLKHVFNVMQNSAAGGAVVFDNAAPAGVPYSFHIKTFSFTLTRLCALIWEKTQTVMPNKLVISPDIWFIVEAQDGFVGENSVANDGIAGPRKVGRLTRHMIDVYVDPTYTNASGTLSYKGPEFVSTSVIVGMYIPLYKSPIHHVAFRKDIALLSEYAIHVVDTETIGTLSVINL
jgi:hypothetical protein